MKPITKKQLEKIYDEKIGPRMSDQYTMSLLIGVGGCFLRGFNAAEVFHGIRKPPKKQPKAGGFIKIKTMSELTGDKENRTKRNKKALSKSNKTRNKKGLR